MADRGEAAPAGDPVDLLARTLAQDDAIVGRVRREQAALPTPCRSWDVRTLVNHLVHDVRKFTVMAHGGSREPGDEADVIGDDWAAAYREAAASRRTWTSRRCRCSWSRLVIASTAPTWSCSWPLSASTRMVRVSSTSTKYLGRSPSVSTLHGVDRHGG